MIATCERGAERKVGRNGGRNREIEDGGEGGEGRRERQEGGSKVNKVDKREMGREQGGDEGGNYMYCQKEARGVVHGVM